MESAIQGRILYVSAFVPDAQAPHAGGQVASQNLAVLRKRAVGIDVLICSTEQVAKAPLSGQARVHQTPARLIAAWIARLIRGPRAGWLSWVYLDTRANAEFEKRLKEKLSNHAYDAIFCDFTQVILPVWRVLHRCPQKPRVTVCVHDIYTQKLSRERGVVASLLRGMVARSEHALLNWVDEVVTLSGKDRQLAVQWFDCKNVVVKEFESPVWVADVRRNPGGIVAGEILFFANFSRRENSEALVWLLREVMPAVVAQFPQLRLVLLGGGSDAVKVPIGQCPIIRLGYRENPAEAFSTCQLAIAPLAFGAGVKFKVLEAIASGVPILGTPVALEGVDRTPSVYEADRSNFREALTTLLRTI